MAQSPIRETDEEARALARRLIDEARHGALGVRDPETGHPVVSRVAVATDAAGAPVSLVSDLSHHTQALTRDPACSLLLGEPGARGDPLTHPRITLIATARFLRRGEDEHEALAERYLRQQPKAKLYIGFGDFGFLRFEVTRALLNGGFGKAYALTPADLALRNPSGSSG
ncbi:HugZ family protein [Rhodosalinus sediminis]|uniref:HugZ family protein n=1 Tax=Rhodosalinus sediminis TaxID=1940533 RepID=A0A3D9BPD4_9RHOB|nr:pyridoxamine 5'-phosphate oxidase family protein [Rhodosalinus sediminis]REC55385.1 HugZ family protein [Rhodosalinus sediminis]